MRSTKKTKKIATRQWKTTFKPSASWWHGQERRLLEGWICTSMVTDWPTQMSNMATSRVMTEDKDTARVNLSSSCCHGPGQNAHPPLPQRTPSTLSLCLCTAMPHDIPGLWNTHPGQIPFSKLLSECGTAFQSTQFGPIPSNGLQAFSLVTAGFIFWPSSVQSTVELQWSTCLAQRNCIKGWALNIFVHMMPISIPVPRHHFFGGRCLKKNQKNNLNTNKNLVQ